MGQLCVKLDLTGFDHLQLGVDPCHPTFNGSGVISVYGMGIDSLGVDGGVSDIPGFRVHHCGHSEAAPRLSYAVAMAFSIYSRSFLMFLSLTA